jgi:hypothetical protein
MSMFPRHVFRCCEKGSHMSEGLISGFREGVDAEVMEEELEEKVVGIRTLEWWETLRCGGGRVTDGTQEKRGCG